MALLFYAILIGVNLDPKVRAVQERAFGPRPLGMPVLLFVILLETILYLPAIGVFRHAAIIVHQARLDGASMGKLGIFIYLLRVGKLHPELRHSQRVVVTGCLYLFAVLKTWIAYAAYLGI